jgi:lactoylglutathione lyase
MGARFDMIGIFVNDLVRMVAFYRDVLGFESDWDGKGPYAEFKHQGIRFSIDLLQKSINECVYT